MTTELFRNPICLEHITLPGHPERSDRLRVLDQVFEHENFDNLVRLEARLADPRSVLLAHPQSHLDKVRNAIPETGIVQVDGDTTMSPLSFNAAMAAIGGAMEAVDHVFEGKADNAFVATRPPGVAIIDFDVHHGNGTQDIFFDDPSVIYCSTHQMPLYPGTGAKSETGKGNIVNAPLASNDGSDHFREAFKTRILPALRDASADLIIISAGFDAHHRDPLAQINLVAEDFDWATGKIMEIAEGSAQNRLVSLLEGGYDLLGLAESAGAHIYRMMKG
jgi:acetoin utilization deacetylase AcuC-like enzyme